MSERLPFLQGVNTHMAVISGFCGYRYNKEKVNLQKAIAPPYDVIDDSQKQLFSSYNYNFVHVHLNDSHESAANTLQKWIDEDVLKKDDESLYVYRQSFTVKGRSFIRTGLVCLLKLEEWGGDVLPHEQTFPETVGERMQLMETTRANIGQLFMLYKDQIGEIDQILNASTTAHPDIEYVDPDSCVHCLWRIPSNQKIIDLMKTKKVIMADGHHRYNAALAYKNKHPEDQGGNQVMVTLVNSYNSGLLILPTNRVLNKRGIGIELFKEYFDVEELDNLQDIDNLAEKCFVMADDSQIYKLKLKNYDILDEIFADIPTYKDLDVAILHKLIFNKIMNMDEEELNSIIETIKGNEKTIEAIKSGKTAFFLRPPTMTQMFDVVEEGEIMPQKSTFFYPKMFSGLVLNKWR